MVWAVTARGGADTYADSPTVSTTFTPDVGDLIVVAVAAWDTYVTGASATGFGITLTEIDSLVIDAAELTIFAGLVTSSASGSVSVTTSASANITAACVQITGHDDSLAIGSLIPQTISETAYNGGANNAIGTGFSSAFSSSTNATLLVCASDYQSQTFTPQTGFTSYNSQGGTSYFAVDVMLDDSEQSDPEYTPGTSWVDDGAIAMEIVEASAGGSSSGGYSVINNLYRTLLG